MSDPFVKNHPWTLRHVAVLWEASAAGLLMQGEVGGERGGPMFFQGGANETRESLIRSWLV